MGNHGSNAVKTAFVMNIMIFAMKIVAALFTKSAGMMAEAVHSLVDSGNQVLLLYGIKSCKVKEDDNHPFGHGKDEYFISFLVAVMLFTAGGMYSVYEGIHKLLHPGTLEHVYINFAILGASVLLEGYSWWVALKAMGSTSIKGLIGDIKESKDANTVVVFVEDTGALLGLSFALIGNILAYVTGYSQYDAAASVLIGILLLTVAVFLGLEMRNLIVGEKIEDEDLTEIKEIVRSHPNVKQVGKIRTMQLGNGACIVAGDVDFDDDLTDLELEGVIEELKMAISNTLDEKTRYIYLQPVNKKDC